MSRKRIVVMATCGAGVIAIGIFCLMEYLCGRETPEQTAQGAQDFDIRMQAVQEVLCGKENKVSGPRPFDYTPEEYEQKVAIAIAKIKAERARAQL